MRLIKNLVLSCTLMVGTMSHAIIRGQTADPQKSAASVLIGLNGDRATCSGVIVSPHLVITAGHCFDGMSSKTSELQISNRGNGLNSMQTVHLVNSYRQHPLYKKPTAGGVKQTVDIQYDFAYFQTTEDLLQKFGIAESQVPHLLKSIADLTSLIGVSANGIGYGYGISQNPSAFPFGASPDLGGVKKQLSMNVQLIEKLNYLVAFSNEKGRGLCSGDSGGGFFMTAADGTVYVVGVVSGIDSSKPCGADKSFAAYSIVSQSICWILKDSGAPVPTDLNSLVCD